MNEIIKNLQKEISSLEGRTLEKSENPFNTLTKKVIVENDALISLNELIAELINNKHVTIVTDNNTWDAAGEQADKILTDAGYYCHVLNLEPENEEIVEPLAETVSSLRDYIDPDTDLILSIGSGCLTDIGKSLSASVKKPQVAIATAPSVNGFTSSFASLIKDGLKTTGPAPAPVMVIADTEILSKAPREMVASGFADLCSRPVSAADWRIATKIYDTPLNNEALRLAGVSFNAIKSVPEGIQRRDPEALGVLANALMLSGFSMCVAGSSAPASGGEHLISHYWDMNAIFNGNTPPSLHGLQVGIASLITSSLFESLMEIEAKNLDIDKLMAEYPTKEEYEELLKWKHHDLFDIIKETALKKYAPADIQKERLVKLKENWADMWAEIGEEIITTRILGALLMRAGCPTIGSDISLSQNDIRNAFVNARDIRTRFSVLDVAFDIGLLEELTDEVINFSGVAPQ